MMTGLTAWYYEKIDLIRLKYLLIKINMHSFKFKYLILIYLEKTFIINYQLYPYVGGYESKEHCVRCQEINWKKIR